MPICFELPYFPDLALPHYDDLYGARSHSVATSRLSSWFQVVTAGRDDTIFNLRYLFDPRRSTLGLNRRLRIIVLVRAPSAPDRMLSPPRGLLRLEEAHGSAAEIRADCAESIFVLDRVDAVHPESGTIFYDPARWERSNTSRDAQEPFLDEVFDCLDVPAFLDIQLRPTRAQGLRRALVAALADLGREREKYPMYGDYAAQSYRQALDDIRGGSPCEVLISAGSPDPRAAQHVLRSFAVESAGGANVRLARLRSEVHRSGVVESLSGGAYYSPYDDGSGWYSDKLRRECDERNALHPDRMREISRLRVLGQSELVQDLLTLPVPRRGLLRTFPLETDPGIRAGIDPLKPEREIGRIILGRENLRGLSAGLKITQLNKHAFVAGVTGSGKTVTVFNILRQLSEQGVPFLVLEPAKTEYRGLVRVSAELRQGLSVLSPGRERANPLRLNPFEFGPGILLGEHISNLMWAFKSALPLVDPWPAILEDSVWRVYEDRGWYEDDPGDCGKPIPRMSDLLPTIHELIDGYKYDPEVTSTFKAAFRARFVPLTRGTVGRLFDAAKTTPNPEALLSGHTVVELAPLSSEQVNLASMFLLVLVREHLKASSDRSKLKLVLVLEEAHNLVPAPEGRGGEGDNDIRGEASKFISNMLAEMRALGLAIIVVDQTPSAVAPAVLKNTNLKVAHRTVAKDDRECLAHAMLMDEGREGALGRLLPGQAFVYTEEHYHPVLVQNALVEQEPLSSDDDPDYPVNERTFLAWLDANKRYRSSVRVRVAALAEATSLALRLTEEWCGEVERFLVDLRAGDIEEPRVLVSEFLQTQTFYDGEVHGALQKNGATLRNLEAVVRRWKSGSKAAEQGLASARAAQEQLAGLQDRELAQLRAELERELENSRVASENLGQ